MKIRLLSDVHHEFYEDISLYSNKGEDVLVIAGDLDVGHTRCWSALRRFAQHTKHVVYTSGNHEYYHQTIAEFDDYITRFSQNTNIHYLNPGCVVLDGVTFIGATLWSNFGNDVFAQHYCARNISDFSTIRGFNTNKCVELYDRHSGYIKNQYETIVGKKVIVTHFLPDQACVAPIYGGSGTINKYFANDLGSWISELQDTPLWLFGHTHSCVDIEIGDTRVVANPYGYNQNHNYVERLLEV
jgi:predicted phosphodiesterase